MSDRPADAARQVLRDRTKPVEVTYPPPRPGDKPRRPINETMKVYMAGKISMNDWRHDFVHLKSSYPFDKQSARFKFTDWLTYVGPFFSSCGHGCAHTGSLHAIGTGEDGFLDGCASDRHNDMKNTSHQQRVHEVSLNQIDKADIIIAVIDDDAHGTIFEVGYAIAMSKIVILVAGDGFLEAWFPFASKHVHVKETVEIAVLGAEGLAGHMHKRKKCASPIETAFLSEAWRINALNTFDVNVPVMGGRYRIDFADVERKIAIELDGHAFHSDKATFENDRIRERELEEDGWRVLRFAGTEVHHDVAKAVQDAVRWIEKVAA